MESRHGPVGVETVYFHFLRVNLRCQITQTLSLIHIYTITDIHLIIQITALQLIKLPVQLCLHILIRHFFKQLGMNQWSVSKDNKTIAKPQVDK